MNDSEHLFNLIGLNTKCKTALLLADERVVFKRWLSLGGGDLWPCPTDEGHMQGQIC